MTAPIHSTPPDPFRPLTPPTPSTPTHQQRLYNILNNAHLPYLDNLRTIGSLDIQTLGPNTRFRRLNKHLIHQELNTIQQPEAALRELDRLNQAIDENIRLAREQEFERQQKKSKIPLSVDHPDYSKTDRKAIDEILDASSESHPLLYSILNKKTKKEITELYKNRSLSEQQLEHKQAPSLAFQAKVEAELDQRWHEYFPDPADRRTVAKEIADTIAADAGDPGVRGVPVDRMHQLLNRAFINYSKNNNTGSVDLVDQLARDSAQALAVDAWSYQNTERPENIERARERFSAADPFFALKQNKSPTYSPKSGMLRNYARARMVDRYTKSFDDDEVNQRVKDSAGHRLTTEEKRMLLRRQIYNGVILWEQGVDENYLQSQHRHLESISNRLGHASQNQASLNQIQDIKGDLEQLRWIMEKNPQAASRYLSIFANSNHLKKSISKLDRAGLRFKIPYVRHTLREKKTTLLEPVTNVIYAPFMLRNKVSDLTYKVNPIAIGRRYVRKKVLKIRQRVGNALYEKAKKYAVKKGVKGLAGKLLAKAGLAIMGVETGIVTVIAILSMIKDVVDIIGLKRLLKWTATGLIAGTLAIYLLLELLLAKIGTILSGIASGALLGAGIGLVLGGPIGAAIGGIIGGILGGVGAAIWGSIGAALSAAWAGITGAVSTAATAIATGISTFFTSTAVSFTTAAAVSVAGSTAAVGMGGLMLTSQQAEINTLRVGGGPIPGTGPSEPFIEMTPFCWPTTGYLCQLDKPPHNGMNDSHNALDICATRGTPIYSPVNGTVVQSGKYPHGSPSGDYGEWVVIQTQLPNGTSAHLIFAHLVIGSAIPKGPVVVGQKIGIVDDSGTSSGDHLHYELSGSPLGSRPGVSITSIVPEGQNLAIGQSVSTNCK